MKKHHLAICFGLTLLFVGSHISGEEPSLPKFIKHPEVIHDGGLMWTPSSYLREMKRNNVRIPQLPYAAAINAPSVASMAVVDPARVNIEKELARKNDEKFEKFALRDFVSFLKKRHRINIWIDHKVIKEEKVKINKPITFQAKNISLSSTLKQVLKPHRLKYYVDRNAIIISAQYWDDWVDVSSKVYDIRKLTAAGFPVEGLLYLIANIQRNWNGSASTIYVPGALVVSKSYEGHQKVFQLLQSLEQVTKLKKGHPQTIHIKQLTQKEDKRFQRLTASQISAARSKRSVARMDVFSAMHLKIEQELQNQTEIKATFTPLKDVVKYLSKHHKIPIRIDGFAIELGELDPDVLVNFTCHDMKLENALDLMFKPLGLSFYVKHDSLLISEEQLNEEFDIKTVVYDVRKLKAAGYADHIFYATLYSPHISARWGGDGESSAYLRMTGDNLVVTQTRKAHREILSMLQQFERVIDRKTPQKIKLLPTKLKAANTNSVPPISQIRKASIVEQKIEKVLQKRISVKHNYIRLENVIKDLRKQLDIKIIIDPAAVSGGELELDLPVSIVAKNMTVESVLKLVLTPYELAFHIRDDALVITTHLINLDHETTVVYDVRKLLAAGYKSNDLVTTITQCTSWGHFLTGDYGEPKHIIALPGTLVVKHHFDGHQEVFDLLKQFERVVDRKYAKPVNMKLH